MARTVLEHYVVRQHAALVLASAVPLYNWRAQKPCLQLIGSTFFQTL